MTGCHKQGFTLLEVMVAVSIFSLVLVVMTSIYTRFVASQRRQIGEQTIQQDVRFALELFQHEARTAYASSFALTDRTGASVVFRNQNGTCVNYRLEASALVRAEEELPASASCRRTNRHTIAITTTGTIITAVRFDPIPGIVDSGGRLASQGFISLMLRAASTRAVTPALELQTTVTSRQVQPYG